MKLKGYRAKRKFARTPEPEPGRPLTGDRLVFVVQKHAARAVHYDLRLEMEGVLKSWAVPKGPSLNPADKRLAVQVEDHPYEYKDFEGVIPDGEYGAGSVIVWDRGTYHHPAAGEDGRDEKLLAAGLEKGDLKFILHGEKLKGEFALVKMRADDKSWLLLKKKDRFAAEEDILRKSHSVATDRTLSDVTADNPRPSSRRRKLNQIHFREALEGEDLSDAPAAPMPRGVRPMLATLVEKPFDDPDWLFEMKWDGYRAIAEIESGKVKIYSRNGIVLNARYPLIVQSLAGFGFEAVLDGEIVVVDDRGEPVFQMLQDYGKTRRGHLLYYVFDLLHFEGRDLTGLPLVRRKEILKKILPADPRVRFSDHVVGEGVRFFQAVKEKGLEGIVAKAAASVYRMGARSRHWLKVKTELTQEGVIAGFTAPKGTRRHLGALVLGVYERKELVFIGHAGGGFSAEGLKEVRERLAPLIRETCPFKVEPETNTPVTWVDPELVCEVKFQGWTDEGIMRQPVFLRLREDKAASEVRRET